uniref:Tetratricopeptide repeat-containing protein n=1 Tax=Candidatus Kentrum sp. FM TaxID=2126340 RepID=A0A450SSR4_9GAMM|nr:MAG: Tetratricopeptide repeat-containing protein [Candidatus Kentron sp. FM]VFJ56942.1 MAG: Tetratricopeptide repeat-containing protein [Candidatus Kentron sp. FM]VFK05906.1 MAG: Tetratricopeptide repeat-containing protein [Candidatus Kentron sp. FM]
MFPIKSIIVVAMATLISMGAGCASPPAVETRGTVRDEAAALSFPSSQPPKMDSDAGADAGGGEKPLVESLSPAHRAIIDAVTGKLRAKTGREPKTEAIVGALNRATVGLLYDGKHRLAERAARAALGLAERKLGKEHPDTLVGINNLANLYSLQGRHAQAEPLLVQALRTSVRVLGKEHPHTLTSINALAFLYEARGYHEEATPLLVYTLAVRKRVLGDRHADTRDSFGNLARSYSAQGLHGEAESLYALALQINQRVLGEKHPDTLATRLALAVARINNRKIAPALGELRRIGVRLREVIDALPVDAREEKARRGWLVFQSEFHDVVFNLALMDLSEDTRPDTLRLAADTVLGSRYRAGRGGVVIAHLARTGADPWTPGPDRYSIRGLIGREGIARETQGGAFTKVRIRTEVERIAAQLTRFGYTYRDHLMTRGVDWSQVRTVLPPDSALLLSRVFHPMDLETGDAGEQHRLGLLIPAGSENEARIILKDLGPAASTPQVTDSSLESNKTDSGETTREPGAMHRISHWLSSRGNLFSRNGSAPDGVLHNTDGFRGSDRGPSGYQHIYIALEVRGEKF